MLIDENSPDAILNIGIHNGHFRFPFYVDEIFISDGLWHEVSLIIDHVHSSFFIKLDQVFVQRFHRTLHKINQIRIGSKFNGCFDQFFVNRKDIFQDENIRSLFEIQSNCSLVESFNNKSNFCSLYQPCYHAGVCESENFNFTCHCISKRFAGDQCEIDLRPCLTFPCPLNQQCFHLSVNRSVKFHCRPMNSSLLRKVTFSSISILLTILFISISIVICRKQIIRSSNLSRPNYPVQILLKLNYKGQPTIETKTIVRPPVRLNFFFFLNPLGFFILFVLVY